jgi:asparagine synthase (glutamine-hydrolysing)
VIVVADGDLQGAPAAAVRQVVAEGTPFAGIDGFAGRLDGALVRDVLGRYPLFAEAETSDPVADGAWSADPTTLDDPVAVPAGHRRTRDGDERVLDLPLVAPATDERAAVRRVHRAIGDALTSVPTDDVAVAFSGGVDSALLAAALEVPCYVVGFPESHDVETARAAADRLALDLTVETLSHADIEAAVPTVSRATGRTNAMDVSIALPLYLVAQRAAADGVDHLVVGQGADELFGGYAKVAKAPDDPRVAADTVRGARREVVGTLPAQLERDVLGLRAAGVEPVAPYLADDVVTAALGLPGRMLVTDRGERKWALRLAARQWLPDATAFRDKKAVQYGSLVSRELDRLARQAGYKRRMDDHVTRYVESLLE